MTFPATTTTVPGGSRTGLTWMVTAGVALGGGRARDTRSGLALHGSGKGPYGPGPRPRGLARREPGAVAARSGADRGEAEGARHPAVAALRLLRTATGQEHCAAAVTRHASEPALQGCRARQRDVLLNSGSGRPCREQGAWMNKSELAERLAGRAGMSKAAAKDAVDGVFEVIGEALANGDEARILGFSTFGHAGTARPAPRATRGRARPCRSPLLPFRCSRRARRSRMPWAAERHEWGPNPARGTRGADEGLDIECARLRHDDRRETVKSSDAAANRGNPMGCPGGSPVRPRSTAEQAETWTQSQRQ